MADKDYRALRGMEDPPVILPADALMWLAGRRKKSRLLHRDFLSRPFNYSVGGLLHQDNG